MNLRIVLLMSATPAFILSACNHSAIEKDVDVKLSRESDVTSGAALYTETTATIENAKNVTPEQKSQLLALRTDTREQLENNNQKTLKLKSILIEDLVKNDYKENEVELIKDQLKGLKTQRLTIMFGAVTEANKILGRQARLNDDVMRDFVRIQHEQN